MSFFTQSKSPCPAFSQPPSMMALHKQHVTPTSQLESTCLHFLNPHHWWHSTPRQKALVPHFHNPHQWWHYLNKHMILKSQPESPCPAFSQPPSMMALLKQHMTPNSRKSLSAFSQPPSMMALLEQTHDSQISQKVLVLCFHNLHQWWHYLNIPIPN